METDSTKPTYGNEKTPITAREMKREGRKTLKAHYIFLILICLTAAVLGSEYSDSLSGLKRVMFNDQAVQQQLQPEEEQAVTSSGAVSDLSASTVLLRCITDGVEAGSSLSKDIQDGLIESVSNPALGRTRGVLSSIVNYIGSGTVWVSLLSATRNLLHSETAADILVIIGAILGYIAFAVFVQGFYRVLMQRMFLECRTYRFENYGRLLHFIHVKRWGKASVTMLVTAVLESLWYLTIIGGFIKTFSYKMVPYITAENPDINPLEAITLSRRMMNGHKWDCFVKWLSFLGWRILGIVTFGISDLLFTNAYESASFAEYYVQLRALAKEKKIESTGRLNDQWLFEKAPKELLEQAYRKEKTELDSNEVHVPKRRPLARFLAEWAGVIVFRTPEEVEYEKEQRKRLSLLNIEEILQGESYPVRLSPVPDHQINKRVEGIYYDRNYTAISICLLYLFFSFVGWLWEGILTTINTGTFVNRGALIGPWLPIYGGGCVLVLLCLKKLRSKPLLHFFVTILLCGTLEYLTGYTLEMMHGGKKWWDYSGYFLNLHGRICAEGLLVFGVLGTAVVYVIAPIMDSLIRRIPMKIAVPVTAVLMSIFLVDDIHSLKHPNEGAGVTDIEAPVKVVDTGSPADQIVTENTAEKQPVT